MNHPSFRCGTSPGDPTVVRQLDLRKATWDSDLVTQAAKRLIEEFEALPEGERSEIVAELARRVAQAPHDIPNDEDLLVAADRLFNELDRNE